MVEMTQYQRLNPFASALATGCTELIFALIVGLPMMGMGGMMNGYGMMGQGYAVGLSWWLGGAVVAALAGAVFAWLYNAFNR